MYTQNNFSIQGHRGCRGLLPENTLPAFIKAIELGVTTIEMDVVISKDKQVVVSHEPWMNHEICLDKNGIQINASDEMHFNIYQMNYDEVKEFDCGTKVHPRFPNQLKSKTFKPLLSEVIDTVENYCATHQLKKINYNIEIKSLPQGDNLFHPIPETFCELVIDVLKKKNISRFNLQSFDFRILKYLHEHFPEIKLAVLIENTISKLPSRLSTDNESLRIFESGVGNNFDWEKADVFKRLGFIPEIFSPQFTFVNESLVLFCRKNNIQLIPWTVNEKNKMEELIELGVDGIITDYPDKLIAVLNSNNK